MRILMMLFLVYATQAQADLDATTQYSQTLYADLAVATSTLDDVANNDCTASALKPAYHSGFDAWVAASVIQFGPILEIGGPLNFSFLPDKKGFTSKQLNRMISAQDTSVEMYIKFKEVSVAGRGFMALEMLLFDDAFSDFVVGSYTCALVRAITTDINTKAQTLNSKWQGSFAQELDLAISGSGTEFLNQKEVVSAYLTSVISGLEYIETNRLARPLASTDRPRPKRAEAWRSARSLRNIQISLQSLSQLAIALADGHAPETTQRFNASILFAKTVSSTDFQDVGDLSIRFQLGSLASLVNLTREAVSIELSQHLGVTAGFNALDGD